MNHAARRLADNIQPNNNGLPGVAEAEKIVGALLTFGLIAAVGGIAIAAITWALGSHSSNPTVASRGKSAVLISCFAALLIGGADLLVTFFASAGASLS